MSAVVLSIISAAFVRADSVTWIDRKSAKTLTDRTLNGRIKIAEGKLTLDARFASGSVPYEIPMSDVRRVEITNVFFNPGAPPKASALAEGPKVPSPVTASSLVTNAVELRGGNGDLQPCRVLTIDETTVRCEAEAKAKPIEYPRSRVLRIIVRGDQ
jgi:hypothetical protein